MGAWNSGSFDNDDAWDWIGNFGEKPGLPIIMQALTTVTEFGEDDYLELPECGAGVVAAELVAALNQRPHPEMPEELAAWVRQQSLPADPELSGLAVRALRRIDTNSEAQELWDDSGNPGFHAAMKDLEGRVTVANDSPP